MSKAATFWKAMGGRKAFQGYLAYLTLTLMAFALNASFGEYAVGILAALGITSGLVAYEDKVRAETSAPDNPSPEPTDGDPRE